MITLAQQSRPSWDQGFARSQGESAYPEFWPMAGAWSSSFGPTGATLHDVSDNHNGGVITNGSWEIGRDSYSLALTSGNVNLVGFVSTSQNYTVASWVNRTQNGYLLDSSAGRFIISLNSSVTGLGMYDGSWHSFSSSVPSDRWVHVAVTCDAAAGASAGYIDGQLSGIGTYTGIDIGGETRLGSKNNGAAPFLQGLQGDVYLWERVLTSNQIQTLHRVPSAPFIRKANFSLLSVPAAGGGVTLSERSYPRGVMRGVMRGVA